MKNTTEVHFFKMNGVVTTIDVTSELNIRDFVDTCKFILQDNHPKYVECRFYAFGSIYKIENPFVYHISE